MKIKTFISPASHKSYFDLITRLLEGTPIEQKSKNQIYLELISQKESLEQIFKQYQANMEELHRLITEYHAQQVRLRKNIRQIQIRKGEQEEPGAEH